MARPMPIHLSDLDDKCIHVDLEDNSSYGPPHEPWLSKYFRASESPYKSNILDDTTIFFSQATFSNIVIRGLTDILKELSEMSVQADDYSDEDSIDIEPELGSFEDDKFPLYSEIYRVYRECSEENWDAYDGTGVTEKVFLEARELIHILPRNLPYPEVMPEPTGEIAFEWYKDRRHVFTISVGGQERIWYAGLFGRHSQTHGFEHLSDQFPESIIRNIQRLYG